MPWLEQLLLDSRLATGGQSTQRRQGSNNWVQLTELAEAAVWRSHDHRVYFPLTVRR